MNCIQLRPNEGKTDRIIRISLGLSALIVGYYNLTGQAQSIAYIIGVISLFTGFFGYCGLYSLLGISTCSIKKTDKK